MQNDNIDKMILKYAPAKIESSAGFEAKFWRKVSERERTPRLVRAFEWIPVPSFAQVAAAVLIAVLIGGAGGAVSAMSTPGVKGISSSSVASTYFKLIGSENVK